MINRKKKLADISSYMKLRLDNTPDPFSIQDELFDNVDIQHKNIYSVFAEDNGRLDLISIVAYGSDKYEEIVGVINKIRDQFEDLYVDRELILISPTKLYSIMEDTENLI